ncbi:hypothetical protein AAEX28_09680 [Lentisphaerota bacterium WC36G]|nr:hypothetical protein LJT99_12515 [Lentisphaerae bacterium WC36]
MIELCPKSAFKSKGKKYELKQFNEAIADYDKDIEFDSKYMYPYSCRADVKYELRQLDNTLADYNKDLKIDPNKRKKIVGEN